MELARWRSKSTLSPLGLDILDWFNGFSERPNTNRKKRFCPSAESYMKGNTLHLRAEIPGVDPKGVSIKVEDGHLCINGERKRPESATDSCYCVEEMGYGPFERCFHLPEHVEAEKIHAKYEDGILSLTIPLGETVTGKTIPIK